MIVSPALKGPEGPLEDLSGRSLGGDGRGGSSFDFSGDFGGDRSLRGFEVGFQLGGDLGAQGGQLQLLQIAGGTGLEDQGLREQLGLVGGLAGQDCGVPGGAEREALAAGALGDRLRGGDGGLGFDGGDGGLGSGHLDISRWLTKGSELCSNRLLFV
jgi:hypothetical protein